MSDQIMKLMEDTGNELRALRATTREQAAEIARLKNAMDGWTVPEAEHEKWYQAAMGLFRACKDRLPPGHYEKLSDEMNAIRDLMGAALQPPADARRETT